MGNIVSKTFSIVIAAAAAMAISNAVRFSSQGGDNSFRAASPDGPDSSVRKGPGIQSVIALCEVTGGGQKVFGIAVQYDAAIDPASLTLDTFEAGVVPAAKGYFPGIPQAPNKNATATTPINRPVKAIYTNSQPELRKDQRSIAGPFVIAEFEHDPDLSLPTSDSDKVTIAQKKSVKTKAGAIYKPSAAQTNEGRRSPNVVIRGVDEWEQNHWWWDDKRSAWLEYSIYLPKSFLKEGGENKEYPLVIAITHSGTSYDGTCAATLTEQCIASIWAMPENQAQHECVVITPRYERTTLNDYWEHTFDVENTYRLVETMLENRWNYGNPNKKDRRDKVLKIDRKRVYCTGWSMGAMTSLWMMAKHPDTFAAGLIIAGQQRPSDLVELANQKLLIITGANDQKSTGWNEECVPMWQKAGAKVTRPKDFLDPNLIFPIGNQAELSKQINGYIGLGGNITFLTFANVDHMAAARKFFYIQATRDWLLSQSKP